MSQPMYRIKNGSLKGYSICEMCGSVLDIYLDYHQCLLQPEIIQAHMELLKDLSKCPFHLCNSSNDSVKDYMNHLLLFHSSVVVFSCPTCGIGFITKSGLKRHRSYCSLNWTFSRSPSFFVSVSINRSPVQSHDTVCERIQQGMAKRCQYIVWSQATGYSVPAGQRIESYNNCNTSWTIACVYQDLQNIQAHRLSPLETVLFYSTTWNP